MATNEIILTPEGRDKLRDELAWREGEKDAEIIAAIKEARDHGDLSENAEFDAAKEEQAQNAARIAEIRKILSNAKISEASGNVVSIGSTVTVEDEKGKYRSFKIVGTTETDSLAEPPQISNESPVGAALIGSAEGETVDYATPSGKKRSFKVVKISR